MDIRVERRAGGYRLAGEWAGVDAANAFLGHLEARAFAAATVMSLVLAGERFVDGVLVRRPPREEVQAA